MDRTKDILENLKDVEREHRVRILLAVESGSRAWGFESANSDWDVRFIYVHKLEWYLRIEPQHDVIEVMDDEIDLVGWELRKALGLLKRSNPSMMEWLNSPIVYSVDEAFLKRIKDAEPHFFNPTASMYHYMHMFAKHDEHYLQREDCTMKRFLYYLRGVLACEWISENRTLPPVAFAKLVDETVADEDMRTKIQELVDLKKSGMEHSLAVVDSELARYARVMAERIKEHADTFRPERPATDDVALDSILYDTVMECHGNDDEAAPDTKPRYRVDGCPTSL